MLKEPAYTSLVRQKSFSVTQSSENFRQFLTREQVLIVNTTITGLHNIAFWNSVALRRVIRFGDSYTILLPQTWTVKVGELGLIMPQRIRRLHGRGGTGRCPNQSPEAGSCTGVSKRSKSPPKRPRPSWRCRMRSPCTWLPAACKWKRAAKKNPLGPCQ